MWAKTAGQTLAALDSAKTEDGAFAVLTGYARAMGADLLSYHHIAPPFAKGHDNITVLATGYPPEWVDAYRSEQMHRIDPITSYASYQTRPVLWSEVPERMRMTPEQEQYMTLLRSWLGQGDGMAVPAFGPSGRHGYVGVGRRAGLDPWSPAQIRTVQAVCETFHLRFCEIRLAGLAKDFELTERETLIMEGMAQGWSDPMIGASANLRPDAVRTAMLRIMEKMGVTDRPSAVLRARSLQLVDV